MTGAAPPAVDHASRFLRFFKVGNKQFVALLTKHYPTWREARQELNELPLGAESSLVRGVRWSDGSISR